MAKPHIRLTGAYAKGNPNHRWVAFLRRPDGKTHYGAGFMASTPEAAFARLKGGVSPWPYKG